MAVTAFLLHRVAGSISWDRFINGPSGSAAEEQTDAENNWIRVKDELKKAKQDILNKILPEAFAVVREASRRTSKGKDVSAI